MSKTPPIPSNLNYKGHKMPAPKGHPPYNTKGEGGRPKIYTKEFIDKEADHLQEWMKDKNNIFVEDFCFDRGYHESRIDEFVRDSERFSLTYSMFKMKQKTSLYKGGLNKKYAYPMCALLLGHNHKIYAKEENREGFDPVLAEAFLKFNEYLKDNHKPVVE